ncbi:uncharacterized protein CLUP02_18272 [Colletotrichum lupini]|uniref:Uncharacterized protein n=1 Tax=Colletotrichum lupini TaxID=145971 RepID=A0A9Q8SHU2_9PEZI|nr:uncharacterized protein CLUP02_18272 [Colletotrichum lupini]UQC76757.1 hypothetical protein CLUP02_18272 [Colletotrichum lupini]
MGQLSQGTAMGAGREGIVEAHSLGCENRELFAVRILKMFIKSDWVVQTSRVSETVVDRQPGRTARLELRKLWRMDGENRGYFGGEEGRDVRTAAALRISKIVKHGPEQGQSKDPHFNRFVQSSNPPELLSYSQQAEHISVVQNYSFSVSISTLLGSFPSSLATLPQTKFQLRQVTLELFFCRVQSHPKRENLSATFLILHCFALRAISLFILKRSSQPRRGVSSCTVAHDYICWNGRNEMPSIFVFAISSSFSRIVLSLPSKRTSLIPSASLHLPYDCVTNPTANCYCYPS